MHLVLVRFKAWLESLDYARSMLGENGSNLSPTTEWVNAFFQAVDGSRLSADLAHTRCRSLAKG